MDPLLPRTLRVLEEGLREGWHSGAQVSAWLHGQEISNVAWGEAYPGQPMRPDTLTLWLSSGKPLTALAIAQLWEQQRISLSDPVAHHWPEFGQGGKETITIQHLLTHTAGFRPADLLPEDLSWDQTLVRIAETPLEQGWVPGEKAGYQTSSSWFVLGELVRKLTGNPIRDYVRRQILEPLQLFDTWMGIPPEKLTTYSERLSHLYLTQQPAPRPHPTWNREPAITSCRPGSNVRGPVRELAALYAYLANQNAREQTESRPVLRSGTIQEFTRRHRAGMFDETFRQVLDWGLGFLVNSNHYGGPRPYQYGEHASADTFGHSGSQSSCGFADPVHGLAVAWFCNGQPGEPRHQRRAQAINTAIYEDLGLATNPPA